MRHFALIAHTYREDDDGSLKSLTALVDERLGLGPSCVIEDVLVKRAWEGSPSYLALTHFTVHDESGGVVGMAFFEPETFALIVRLAGETKTRKYTHE